MKAKLNNVLSLLSAGLVLAVTDTSGSVTGHAAHLEVDPTFTKITPGRIVTDIDYSFGCAWG